MGRILGLDLGTNSIGWAVYDKTTNNITDYGVTVSQKKNKTGRINKIKKIKKYLTPFIALITFTIISLIVTFFDKTNWQFWLNISLTGFITCITSQQNKKR
ncbi:hypothetical protein [Flavobacterium gawalongense]|uniref:Uncharacterized protein n=1 Tax=Flavobacterium gawalongense TaxID=2594432 RepID=A0A553BBE3_9FLAO|nr:hypothetical protein [Flavobacterium gawalongense]TRX01358.1 hypothetical protein FNW33_09610 [Flavobacterium gawalongense]TRX05575.1 hypothetical protein FNW11_15960 [Flavobacterium gawalongense]TRX05882.1 hypothetical protein FNW12_09695 [Flavobacterium gawalongense]TRX06416.1 hypothetical protein FNW10_16015 [Flavobacterium gawalongense]TRX22338.1 hypothetical protein FNW38_16050 [Flavobacterium gawalongense]